MAKLNAENCDYDNIVALMDRIEQINAEKYDYEVLRLQLENENENIEKKQEIETKVKVHLGQDIHVEARIDDMEFSRPEALNFLKEKIQLLEKESIYLEKEAERAESF